MVARSNQQGIPDGLVVAFGDSFSDTGRLWDFSNHTIPDDHYWQGRFTSEPGNWQDYVSGAPVQTLNYAWGGATACKYPGDGIWSAVPSLNDQVRMFLNDTSTNASVSALVANRTIIPVIWAGHTDVIVIPGLTSKEQSRAPIAVAGCIMEAVALLLSSGLPVQVVVGTMAPLDLTPLAANQTGAVSALVSAINLGLRISMANARGQASVNQTARVWEANRFLGNLIKGAAPDGNLAAVTTPCLQTDPATQVVTACDDPSTFLFFDQIHPTSQVHSKLAGDLLQALQQSRLLNTTATGTADAERPDDDGTAVQGRRLGAAPGRPQRARRAQRRRAVRRRGSAARRMLSAGAAHDK